MELLGDTIWMNSKLSLTYWHSLGFIRSIKNDAIEDNKKIPFLRHMLIGQSLQVCKKQIFMHPEEKLLYTRGDRIRNLIKDATTPMPKKCDQTE